MSNQIITLDLRRWIDEQTASGVSDEAVLEAMVTSGWQREVARGALREALRARPPRATGLPEPKLAEGAHSVPAGDREVRIVTSVTAPRVIVFADLLTADECDELVALSRERLERSETVHIETGGSEINAARTSDGMFFERGENPLVARIEARIAALLNWPVENGEGLQILRYGPGAEYKPHYDYFDPAEPGTPVILRRGGQRLASLVMYLNTPPRGGATVFPDIGLTVAPQRGHAVFFSYDRPHPDTRTLHGGAPVLEGEKWVATKWLREDRFT
jgi:prolyl 4-hydroxylase